MDATPDWLTVSREEKARIVTEMVKEGLSNTVIAARFRNCSRNSIAGIINRLKLHEQLPRRAGRRYHSDAPAEPVKAAPKKPVARKPAANPRPVGKRVPTKPSLTEIREPVDRSKAFLPLPGVTPMAVVDTPAFGRCRWPVNGDGYEPVFCGAPTADTRSYCPAHHRLSIPTPQPCTKPGDRP